MTTTGGSAGRPGASGDEVTSLAVARRVFARAAEALDREVQGLAAPPGGGLDRERIKPIETLVREAQRALLILLEFEAKLDRREADQTDGALDLEAARAEITGRLARLAGRG